MSEALDAGKSVALPRHLPDADHYIACRVTDPHSAMVAGKFGISEPHPDSPIVLPNELDFALVPGIGFSLDGGRRASCG